MTNSSIYLDYDPHFGIENPDQVYKLPVPREIQEQLANTIKQNLNTEIENDRPKYRNMLFILVGILIFIICLNVRFLDQYTRFTLAIITLSLIIIKIFMIMTSLPLKERLIPVFLAQVKFKTNKVITVKQMFEYRVKLQTKKNDLILEEFEILVGFLFTINKKKLREYQRKMEKSSEALLIKDNEEKA